MMVDKKTDLPESPHDSSRETMVGLGCVWAFLCFMLVGATAYAVIDKVREPQKKKNLEIRANIEAFKETLPGYETFRFDSVRVVEQIMALEQLAPAMAMGDTAILRRVNNIVDSLRGEYNSLLWNQNENRAALKRFVDAQNAKGK